MAKDTAVLILNHVQDRHLMKFCREILDHYGSSSDVFLLTDRTQSRLSFSRRPPGCREFTFTIDDMVGLGYPRCRDIRSAGAGDRNFKLGNADLPVLLFHREHGHYQYVWIVEYDVRFSGNWRSFFSAFDDNRGDLLGTSLLRRESCPQWNHWDSLRWPEGESIPPRPIRGFFPVYRLSSRALATMDEEYRRGVAGHMEALMPTVLHQRGLVIEDIGGQGEFVQPENLNRFYHNDPASNSLSPGTFVYRPVMRAAGAEPNLLWHPVKREKSAVLQRVGRTYARGTRVLKRMLGQ
jgi:hypothetical protein